MNILYFSQATKTISIMWEKLEARRAWEAKLEYSIFGKKHQAFKLELSSSRNSNRDERIFEKAIKSGIKVYDNSGTIKSKIKKFFQNQQ